MQGSLEHQKLHFSPLLSRRYVLDRPFVPAQEPSLWQFNFVQENQISIMGIANFVLLFSFPNNAGAIVKAESQIPAGNVSQMLSEPNTHRKTVLS